MPTAIRVPSPPFVKVLVLKRYGRQYGLKTFVETGTFMGNTTASMAEVIPKCRYCRIVERTYVACSATARRPRSVVLVEDARGHHIGQIGALVAL